MEAWIVHIHEEWIADEKTNRIEEQDSYSAWATENQALRAVADFFKTEVDRPWGGTFVLRTELQAAVEGLLEANKIRAAIGLINRYTTIEGKSPSQNNIPRKVRIFVKPSKFLGSPFE